MVASVKWVDEVIENTPYEITETFMAELFDKHNIDFIVHGDDPCLLPVRPAPARPLPRLK
jgi:ethanolamine-phosphate cytidylyltransferase